jgi:hypothetical protein
MTAQLACRRHAVRLPNTSLKLTRRAALSGWLALPAGKTRNPSEFARFRRAA